MIFPLLLCLVTTDTLDLTLDQALSIAARESPSYADARLDSAEGWTKYLSGWSKVLPNLSASAGLGWTSSKSPYDSGRTTTHAWSLGASASQVVFSAAVLGGVAQGYAARQLAETQSGSKINQLLYNVKNSYFSLQKVYDLLTVAREAVRTAEENHNLAQVKLRLGKATGLEVMRAQTNLSQARLNLMTAESGVLTASEGLKALLGLGGDVVIRPEATDTTPPAPALGSLEEYWQQVRSSNPGIKLAQQSVKAAELGRTVAYGALLPTLSFSISNSYSSDRLPGPARRWSDYDNTRFGFNLGLPILDIPDVLLGIRTARIAVNRARLAEHLTEIQSRQSVVSAWLNYEQATRQVGYASENLKLNRELLRLGQEQYRLGQITQLDLLAIEAGLTQARISYLNAQSDAHRQQAQLDYLLGR